MCAGRRLYNSDTFSICCAVRLANHKSITIAGPVSRTFTDPQFLTPMGCQNILMTAQKNSGRGVVTTFAPTIGSGYRGELEISDEGFGNADVYDVTVTLECQGAAGPHGNGNQATPIRPVRLSCTHNTQTDSCHMGRLEVYNPRALHADGIHEGTWGTVCGHYICKASCLLAPHF